VLAAELGAGRHRLTSFRRETPTAIATSERQPSERQPAEREPAQREPAEPTPAELLAA
jgi:hypothetical protein